MFESKKINQYILTAHWLSVTKYPIGKEHVNELPIKAIFIHSIMSAIENAYIKNVHGKSIFKH